MPNRILRDWTDSLRFDGLSAEAERLFVRLIMKADDFGRFHANPKLVKSACFPLAESLRANTVGAWLTELSDRQLIFCYTVGTGEFLAITNYGQRLKQSRAKFPPKPDEPDDWMPISGSFRELPGTSGNFPSESETYSDAESDTEEETESESEPEGVQGKRASSPPAAAPRRKLKAEPVDDEFLAGLQQRYDYLDVKREWNKCLTWCEQKGVVAGRKRFVNWINRIDPPSKAKSPNGNQGLHLSWGHNHKSNGVTQL